MTNVCQRLVVMALLAAIVLLGQPGAGADDPAPRQVNHVSPAYSIFADDLGTVVKAPDGRTMFRYMVCKPADSKLTANSVCCLFPLNTPSGERAVDFAPADHPHHRGVFLTWHAIEGKIPADFWGWGKWAPTQGRVIENRSVKPLEADAAGAELGVHNQWVAEGDVLVDENTTIAARQVEGVYVVDLDSRLVPQTDLTLRQTAFGGLCVKGRKGQESKYTSPKGEVKLDAPNYLKPETDWPPADWYDYTCTLEDGKTIGVAVFDHPGNPLTLWHNLQAIAMVNPCIVAKGPVELKTKEPLRLRYRLVVHDGEPPTALLERLSRAWRRH